MENAMMIRIKMLRKKLIEEEIECGSDWEVLHGRHDDLLLEFINDAEITEIFNRTPKWCA